MKKLLLLTIAIITLNSCSSDSDEFQPNLSFNIENGSRIASSTINVTNTTTNQNGGYIWEVITSSGITTYTSLNLSFDANRIGEYTIRLKSSQYDLQTEQTINITRPTFLKFNELNLKTIPQNYSSLYFKILKSPITGNSSYTYTSATRQNVNSLVPSVTDWNIDSLSGNTIQISDGSNGVDDANTYFIEFYDGNDNLVTRINPFSNLYLGNTEFIAGEIELTTTTTCNNCDYFKVLAEFSFQ
nr:hypothetical protein [uncultured Psychroserpens sp.]